MTLDYWWSRRNNRRAVRLPDLSAPYVEEELPGTPESRVATCLTLAYRQLSIAHKRSEERQKYRNALRI